MEIISKSRKNVNSSQLFYGTTQTTIFANILILLDMYFCKHWKTIIFIPFFLKSDKDGLGFDKNIIIGYGTSVP
jgi:hypothetical protein